MDNFSDSSENWLVTLDRMMLPSDDSGIGRHIGGAVHDTEDDGRLVVEVRRNREPLGTGICAQIAANGARCFICFHEAAMNERVILFPCGHWVQRVCYNLWLVKGFQVQCPYSCKKDRPEFRSSELRGAEHDVNEAELTDVEELLERDRELAKLEDTLNHPTPTPLTAHPATSSQLQRQSHPTIDSDTSYDADSEDVRRNDSSRVRRSRKQAGRRARREMLERALQEREERDEAAHREEPQENVLRENSQERSEERQPGWFFDVATTDGGDDFGLNDGLTLAQRMYNLPPGRRFL